MLLLMGNGVADWVVIVIGAPGLRRDWHATRKEKREKRAALGA